MSTKTKKKSEKIKTKKVKRAPIKDSYSEEEKVELKHKYTDILFHLSNFLSDHNVYEAIPENAKVLVFSSELSFYEMIKVFIFEDIYCGLIYDAKLNNYLGLITTRDLMILYRYIIDNFPSEQIIDFDSFIKEIFSKQIDIKDLNISNNNENNINNNINIFEHLQNINYIDYLIYVKKKDFQKIRILSVSLDDNLLETLQKINIKNIHRLLVEEENKRGLTNLQKIKSAQKIEKKEEIQKKQKEEIETQKRNSKTEKTSTTNYSDEESKNNAMFGRKEIKKMEDIINEQKPIEEKIIEESNDSNNNVNLKVDLNKEEVKNEEIKKEETKHVKKKIVKKKKKVENENKTEEMQTNENIINEEKDKSKEEIKPKKKKIIKKKKEEKKEDSPENINHKELEHDNEEKEKKEENENKEKNEDKEKNEEIKHKKKKIIKKKKKKIEEITTEANENEIQIKKIPESKTDDELGAKTKKIIKKKIKTERKTTTDVPNLIKKEEKEGNEHINEEKKVIKKKIVKKKIIKKKKKEEDISIDNVKPTNNESHKDDRLETTPDDLKLNIQVENEDKNNDYKIYLGSVTEPRDDTLEKKDKYELPKIKMKRKSAQKRKKTLEEKQKEEDKKNIIEEKKENNEIENNNKQSNESIKDDKENSNMINNEKENKENENIDNGNITIENKKNEEQIKNDNKDNSEENKDENKENINETNEDISTKKEEIENTEIDESKTIQEEDKNKIIIHENQKENNKNIEEQTKKGKEKPKIDIINEIMQNIHLDEMKSYVGIVTNETIFEYLVLNYYSNEMKEFNLSLNELLILEDIPLLLKLTNGRDKNEKVYNTFNNYLFNNSDIIPIFNENELEGFIYPKDFFYYIYNCESQQSLTNEEFLISLYKDIDEQKPYGKNRVTFLEINDKNKSLYVKELIEKLNCSIEKKIIIYDPNDNRNIYLISLKTIFKAIAEFQTNK